MKMLFLEFILLYQYYRVVGIDRNFKISNEIFILAMLFAIVTDILEIINYVEFLSGGSLDDIFFSVMIFKKYSIYNLKLNYHNFSIVLHFITAFSSYVYPLY